MRVGLCFGGLCFGVYASVGSTVYPPWAARCAGRSAANHGAVSFAAAQQPLLRRLGGRESPGRWFWGVELHQRRHSRAAAASKMQRPYFQ
jgi:hypothetical protein